MTFEVAHQRRARCFGAWDDRHCRWGRTAGSTCITQCRTRFCDVDGVLRPVTRWADSEVDAEAAPRAALRDRALLPDGDKAAGTRLADASTVWLAEVEESCLASGTTQLYRAAARVYLIPRLG